MAVPNWLALSTSAILVSQAVFNYILLQKILLQLHGPWCLHRDGHCHCYYSEYPWPPYPHLCYSLLDLALVFKHVIRLFLPSPPSLQRLSRLGLLCSLPTHQATRLFYNIFNFSTQPYLPLYSQLRRGNASHIPAQSLLFKWLHYTQAIPNLFIQPVSISSVSHYPTSSTRNSEWTKEVHMSRSLVAGISTIWKVKLISSFQNTCL